MARSMLSLSKKQQAENSLWNAIETKISIDSLTATFPDITIEDAYDISSIIVQKKISKYGVTIIGKKIGLTSKAVQNQFNVNQPDFGFLTSNMNIPYGEKLPPEQMIQPKAEGEVAFVLKRDLIQESIGIYDIVAAVDYVLPAIEIIDSRIKDWKIAIQDTVADNASSAYFVLGENKICLDTIDLRLAGMTLRKNDEVVSTGVGAACLEHPINAVLWLAKKMIELKTPLKEGDIILSGAYGPVVSYHANDSCEVEISGMGKVSCFF